ncbi:MAG: methyltransferase domain-containing protein [Rhizobiales bacterium]|nr:methyltransferase domain-containing protein [Hyphomicrobiales bacterium]MBO6698949.1 methyltransferase domain-containing protein [Hyphomicrobiales bacterium]MBO6734798.1 methyltransferase domain-containing protein [Hyphomicrobiales bacterium]MBO6911396.1 methyltransferase domain-containing protein [Hyphomicrobiales bacterium]MBO6955471.1 methyltransferase domain-containing protein [Hyphomicrobiales bacterium]
MYESAQAGRDCPKGQMRLVEDLATGLVRNAAFDASLMDYDAAYQNEQGNSRRFAEHLSDVADLILEKIGRDGLIEIGCGKGLFLDYLWGRGAQAKGFDPTYEGDSPLVQKVYFSSDLNIKGRGLILRHVLEHVEDPVSFLFELAAANGNEGLIYIEVPCLDWILENRAWFDVFYEHVNYFRLNDFKRIFGRLVHADRTFGGQYLRVVGDLSTLRRPTYVPLDAVHFPEDFVDSLTKAATSSPPIAVWGGASKGVIFCLFMERAGCKIGRVIDINPAKQGHFLPGTGLRVMSPEEGLADLSEGSVVQVMNPNYLEEIRQSSPKHLQYKAL